MRTASAKPNRRVLTSRPTTARAVSRAISSLLNAWLASTPTPGLVIATRAIPELGVTEWTLSNGVRIVVKPTDFKADEVRLAAFAPGGTSLAPDADYESAHYAGAVTGQGGLGTFDATALRKMLAGKVASVSAHIGELDEEASEPVLRAGVEVRLRRLEEEEVVGPRHQARADDGQRLREPEAHLAEAEPLYRRALAIGEHGYGPDHPTVAVRLNNLALLLEATNRLNEAEPLSRRAVRILMEFQSKTGHEHPDFRVVMANYRVFLEAVGKTSEHIEQQLRELAEGLDSEGA